MSQRRRHSLLESCLNTATGFLVSYLVWPLVCRFVLHVPFHPGRGLEVIFVFTALSIARNYAWRRIFNRLTLSESARRERDMQAFRRRWGVSLPPVRKP